MREAIIEEKKCWGERFVQWRLQEEEIARCAQPGQFVMVRVQNSFDPLLGRPLAIMKVEGNSFYLFFEVVGRGTKILSSLNVGNRLEVLGPLGKGFSLFPSQALIVGGGRGITPLYFLASHFKENKIPFTFFLGVKNKEELFMADFLQDFSGNHFWSCEEPVEEVFCGTVLSLFHDWLEDRTLPSGTRVYACGPEGMLRNLYQEERISGVPLEVSLETFMGCGFGACMSCAVEKRNGDGYFHVCKDGPVFLAQELKW
ncbi:MAG TPA: dihydroorotate dehydrogenase electron transfer subunit [Candidatus Atribacteria bacterium]|nr:dihydroorotate dehydrogenase electron transfer subunit [Candidatus Atribacteria bacterium]